MRNDLPCILMIISFRVRTCVRDRPSRHRPAPSAGFGVQAAAGGIISLKCGRTCLRLASDSETVSRPQDLLGPTHHEPPRQLSNRIQLTKQFCTVGGRTASRPGPEQNSEEPTARRSSSTRQRCRATQDKEYGKTRTANVSKVGSVPGVLCLLQIPASRLSQVDCVDWCDTSPECMTLLQVAAVQDCCSSVLGEFLLTRIEVPGCLATPGWRTTAHK